MVTHILGMDAEDFLHHLVIDERLGEHIFSEYQTGGANLHFRQRQRWGEMSQSAEDSFLGYSPGTEEAHNMVNTEGVEVLFHPAEPTSPPVVDTILFPSVGGESPVLTIGGIEIRGCSHLFIEMEELGIPPCLHTITIDTDGQVAFQ